MHKQCTIPPHALPPIHHLPFLSALPSLCWFCGCGWAATKPTPGTKAPALGLNENGVALGFSDILGLYYPSTCSLECTYRCDLCGRWICAKTTQSIQATSAVPALLLTCRGGFLQAGQRSTRNSLVVSNVMQLEWAGSLRMAAKSALFREDGRGSIAWTWRHVEARAVSLQIANSSDSFSCGSFLRLPNRPAVDHCTALRL